MFVNAYRNALNVLSKKPMMLWGLSLLSGLLSIIASLVFAGVPAAGIIIGYLITCGMAKVYLDGLNGKQVCADQLFACFNKNFLRVAGGMAWSALWVLIWTLVPIVGPFIAIAKSYSYRFVPYILVTKPEVTATQALKLSMNQTNGLKGQMFLADICFGVGVFIIVFMLSLFSAIPVIGVLFALVNFVFIILLCAFSSIFTGLYQAFFYDKQDAIRRAMYAPQYVPQPQAPVAPQATVAPQAPAEPVAAPVEPQPEPATEEEPQQ